MQHRPLGRTGIHVSPLALGAMMFSSFGNGDQTQVDRMVGRALDAGITVVDTADAYGESEEMLGRALRGRRDEVVLATKFGRPMGEDPNRGGASRRWIMTAVEDSLRRLGTDHLDLFQLHRPDPATDIEETLSALTDLVRSGKVRAIGTSDMPASDMVEAHWIAERRGLERFRTEQPHYSLLDRGIEREVLPVAQRQGMGTLIWSPLASGMLTGRVRRGVESDLRRTSLFAALRDERRIDAVEELLTLAEGAGLSLTHMAIAFVIAHPGVTSAIIGPRTPEQLEDLLAAAEVRLTDDVLDRIDEIVPPGTGVGRMDQEYSTPPVLDARLRRRPLEQRAAA
ncbi:aldo/keto reductase [Brachybacterium sp. NBEC-018]|uniref:aldo/keto reductase n=1 Tax=Brachybacterium sp. NBEC-018 TaxID=2996004 RepID=UPI0021756903|nr:aldo/keto reductase [Brachybacterium sp. NBEC-018]UVY85312.1 aldo/keto reductase [Brachybacterium sp. NBEC-018]